MQAIINYKMYKNFSISEGLSLAEGGAYSVAKVAVPLVAAAGILAHNRIAEREGQWAAQSRGNYRPEAFPANFQGEPVSTAGAVRLRRRQRWSNQLVEKLGLERGKLGSFLAGRWIPDLPSYARDSAGHFLSSLLANGAKVLGGGLLPTSRKVGQETVTGETPYLRLGLGVHEHVVLVDLLAKLALYACYRRRDSTLVAALRTRAIEWAKDHGVLDRDAALLVPGTVALAFLRSSPEEAGAELLRCNALEEGGCAPYVSTTKEKYWYEMRQ